MTARRIGVRSALVDFAVASLLGALLLGAGCRDNDGIPPPGQRECFDNPIAANQLFTYYTCSYWDRCRVPGDRNWRRANETFDNGGFNSAGDCRAFYEGQDMFNLGRSIRDLCGVWDCFDAMVNAPCERPLIEEVCEGEVRDRFYFRELPLACVPVLVDWEAFTEECQPYDESVFDWPR